MGKLSLLGNNLVYAFAFVYVILVRMYVYMCVYMCVCAWYIRR